MCLAAVSLTATGIEAICWYVYPDGSGDAPTIQAAIDSTASGDIILVAAGAYYEENITVDGKDISMIDAFEGIPYINAPVPGSGTGFILRNVSSSLMFNSMCIVGFDTGVSIESGSPTINCIDVNECISGVVVSGAASAPFIGYSGGTATFYCNNLFNNTIDYSGCLQGTTDFFDDTVLCFWASLGSSPLSAF